MTCGRSIMPINSEFDPIAKFIPSFKLNYGHDLTKFKQRNKLVQHGHDLTKTREQMNKNVTTS